MPGAVMSDTHVQAKIRYYPDGSIRASAVCLADRGQREQQVDTPGGGALREPSPVCPLRRSTDGGVCPIRVAAIEDEAERRAAANRERAARRARWSVHDYVRSYNLSRLLTFTNGSEREWQSASEALDVFMRWLAAEGRHLLLNAPLLAVAERGDQGRWHVHAAIPSGFSLPFKRIHSSWSDYMNGHGYPSSLASGSHRWHAGQSIGSAFYTACYVAKYVAKSIDHEREKGRHSFRCLNMSRPLPLVFRCDSLTTALLVIGVPEDECYRLEFVDGVTGELHLFGLLVDTGG